MVDSECGVTEVNTSGIGTQLVNWEASDCGVTEINANRRRTKLVKWKAASAALQKSMQAHEV